MLGAQARSAPETWARTLDVRARARADGAAGVPTGEAGPSAAETEIAAALARERARLDDARAGLRAEAERTLRRLKPAAPDLAGPLAAARLALGQIEGRAGPDCAAAREEATRAKTDFEGFRRANNIRRVAVYPDSTLLQAGLLLCAALFESLFSATLFAQEAEQGLLGGAAVAIGLSAANVTLGFLAGFLGLRYMQPARITPRLLGASVFIALIALAALLNIFAARWRESLAAASAAPARIDPFAPRLDLFGFTEPQAVVLLMLGAGVWVFAALKGYSGFDDPYPDYGKMHRAQRRAEEALSEVRTEFREALDEVIEAARAEIEARLAALEDAAAAMRRAYDEAGAELGLLEARQRRAEEEAARLIHLYRQENLAARAGPAPAYFAEPPPTAAPPQDALAACGADLSAAESRLAEARAGAANALAALGGEVEALAARLESRAA